MCYLHLQSVVIMCAAADSTSVHQVVWVGRHIYYLHLQSMFFLASPLSIGACVQVLWSGAVGDDQLWQCATV